MAPITISPAPAASADSASSQPNQKPTPTATAATTTTTTTSTPTPPTSATTQTTTAARLPATPARAPPSTTTASSTTAADPSPWPQIEQNYFTSMRQQRAHEDTALASAHRARVAPLRQHLLDTFKAQEDLLRRLHALRAEYDAGKAELEKVERAFEGEQRERAAGEEGGEYAERSGGGGGEAGEEMRDGDGRDRGEVVGGEEESRGKGEGEKWGEDESEVQGERRDEGAARDEGERDPQGEAMRTSESEQPGEAAGEGKSTNTDANGLGDDQYASQSADQQTTYAPVVKDRQEDKTPAVETTVAAEPPNEHQNEEPEESRAGDETTAPGAAALSGQQEEPQAVEKDMPDMGTLGSNEQSEISTAANNVMETAPADGDTEMGGVEAERGELPEDERPPTADHGPGVELPKPGQQIHTPAPTTSHEASSTENTQPPATQAETPENQSVVPIPTAEDVEMPDVQAAPANAAVEGSHELQSPLEMSHPAPAYPSSSSYLSSRDTTPELGTPVSMTGGAIPPATPGETTVSDLVDVLDEAGDLIGRLRASGTGNSVMDRFSRLPVKRPARIRPGRKFTAEDLDALPRPTPGDARPNKFLSFFVQAMGEMQARPCQDCSSNHGPFQGCVMVSGDPDFARCGNCEWNKRGCHGGSVERPSSSRHSNSTKSPLKSPGKPQTPGTSFTAANKASASYEEDRTGGDDADHSDVGMGSKETAPKKAPRKSLPGSRKPTAPSTPAAKTAETDELPEINKEVLCLKHDGVVFTDPPMMRGVPLAKISPEHPYWEPDWKPIEELVEPVRQKHQEKYDQLDQAGSTHRDKHLANRDAKRGRIVLKFLEEGELHPYQLVGKKWINYRITNYDTLFRLAQLLTEELPRMGLDISPSEWLRHRLHELYMEKGDKFDVASWIGKAYHDRKIEQLRIKNGFPRVGRPPAHATRAAEASSSTKKPPRSLKRKDPHQTPESTPIKLKIPSASKASVSPTETPASASASAASASATATAAASAASAASGQQKPKRIKIITSQPESTSETPSSGKPKIILNSPFPPSATGEKKAAAQGKEAKDEDKSTGLEYDGYTSSDSISEDRLHPNDWRLHQVKTRSFATHPGVTQYWHWVTEKQGDKKVIEHQVLESVQPIKWSVFKKPYNFHLKLGDIQEVSFARASNKVVVTHKKGRDGRDLGPRGHVMAQFKRDRTKRRFLTFLSRERGVKVGEVNKIPEDAAKISTAPVDNLDCAAAKPGLITRRRTQTLDIPHHGNGSPTSPTTKMLYEMIGIVRPGNLKEVKEIVLTAGQLILRQGGVIRDVANWGVFHLPRAVSLNQTRHVRGHYFVLRYDAGVATHQDVARTLRVDPRVIRSGGVKLGDGKLETLSRFGAVEWKNLE
ncbi:hypothetical protein CHGG_05315 [Chaetomium globosum CBS 148.51]|uniref:Small ribosomal subunit protein bS6m n=2 Tax=Chaetomium TaxID=5149 RepID=Q2H7Q0_CHAGB|nr:uncharacterized protein CHGG_05315 [Chaetomium globosum CBS 148.51]EAQ88696.1 hypothetical protein CHGG_05315 [Chaetomium globosum CBS 148.51]